MSKRATDLEILANYESPLLIKRLYKKHHGGEPNTGKAREIAAAFTQARGYMEAASKADRIVRPLLVYYSVLSYSRALSLFLVKPWRETALAQSHGLSAEGWGHVLNAAPSDLATLKVVVNAHGTLPQLMEATGRQSYLRNNSSVPNVIETHLVLPAGAEITLGDMFARFPEIKAAHDRWRDERLSVIVWPQGKSPEGNYTARVDPPYNAADIAAVFGNSVEVTGAGPVLTITGKPDIVMPMVSDSGGHWDIGNLVAMAQYPGGIDVSKIATHFIASYALGMLVRYYPSHWIGILHGHKHDEAMPTLLAALAEIETGFPRIVVDFLERRPQP